MLAILVKIVHIVVCFALIVIVLFQADKGEGLAGAFGGGASGTIFGERGAETQISKMTTYLAVIFMVTSLVLALWGPTWEKEAREAQYSAPITSTQTTTPVTPNPMANPLGIPMPPIPNVAAPIETTPVESTANPVQDTPVVPTTAESTTTTTTEPAPISATIETTPSPVDTIPPSTPSTPEVPTTTIPGVNEK